MRAQFKKKSPGRIQACSESAWPVGGDHVRMAEYEDVIADFLALALKRS